MALNGNLNDFGLPELIQMVGHGRKSGLLHIESEGEECRFFFVAGHPVHAELGELTGEAAFYRAFSFDGGRFWFEPEPRPFCRTIFMDITELLIEAARLTDEGARGFHCEAGAQPEALFADQAGLASEKESWELENPDNLLCQPPLPLALPAESRPEQVLFPDFQAEGAGAREHVASEGKVSPASPEAHITLHPHLIEAAEVFSQRLDSSPLVADYAVFSRDALLKRKYPGELGLPAGVRLDGLAEDAPQDSGKTAAAIAGLVEGAALLGEALGARGPDYLVLRTSLGEQALLFRLAGLHAAVILKKSCRASVFYSGITGLAATGNPAGEQLATCGKG